MEDYSRSLMPLLIEGSIILVGFVGWVLYLFLEKDRKINRIRLRYRSFKEVHIMVWVGLVLGIILVPASIPRFQDYFLKDFQDGHGVFQQYNTVPKSFFTNRIIIDKETYYVPKKLILGRQDKGKECTFKYTKREKLILEFEFED